jgi:CBS-domain-containing membrane protein
MSRRDDYLDALLKHLGAAYYQTLHGEAPASNVARAVASVAAEEAARHPSAPSLSPRGTHGQTGRWRVRDVMRTDAVTVSRWTPATEIARLMSEHRVSAVPVIASEGRVHGVVSEGDLLRSRQDRRRDRSRWPGRSRRRGGDTAAELMTAPAITIHPDAPLAAAARRMTEHRVRLLPVVTPEGDLLGVVSRRNLLSIFLRPDADIADEVRTVLGDLLLIDRDKVTVSARDGAVTLAGQMADESSHQAAIRVASDVDGVAQVIDKLTVPAPASQPGPPA